jgi:23S rRNA pseudouridine1911/1915/1917 synthase
MKVVAPEISISHLTLATMLAAAGSRGLSSSSANGLLMKQGRREEFVAADADAGDRLDRLLAARIADLSRTRVKSLILAGEVSIGGRTIRDPGHRVNANETVAIVIPEPEPAVPQGEDIALNIVYEDDEIIVIDKPKGLVVHPAAGHASGTLVNALIAHCGTSLSGIGGVRRPGIVHRLDKDTTGLMVVAKTDRAHASLTRQFADHGRTGAMRRGYLAFVWGAPDRPRGTIDKPIGRHPHARDKMAVRADGREAVTHWQKLETFAGADGKPVASLLACELETGRTHQIRVHLAHIGHPLMGDQVYGPGFKTKAARLPKAAADSLAALGRQALHAYLLVIEHPTTGEVLEFRMELPADLACLRSSFHPPGTQGKAKM